LKKQSAKKNVPVKKAASSKEAKVTLKIADEIARDLVRQIAERNLKPGAALPHEKTMIAQYGVGRASIREALRIIESQGLIYLKPGRHGGPVLLGTGAEQMAKFLARYCWVPAPSRWRNS
jgi:DNA-binding transcriptional MocR family regulator